MDSRILIDDVEIFNGWDEAAVRGNVLIKCNKIDKVSAAPIPVDPASQVRFRTGKGNS